MKGCFLGTYPIMLKKRSKHILRGFRKGHSTQYGLPGLLQSWQKELDSSGYVAKVLYNCIRLEAYSLDKNGLNLILG